MMFERIKAAIAANDFGALLEVAKQCCTAQEQAEIDRLYTAKLRRETDAAFRDLQG